LNLANLLLGLALGDRFLVSGEFADGFLDFSTNGLRGALYAVFVHLKNSIQSNGSEQWRPERSPSRRQKLTIALSSLSNSLGNHSHPHRGSQKQSSARRRGSPERPVGIFRRCSAGATACMVHRPRLCIEGMTNMGLILILILLVLLFGGGGFYLGAPFHLFGGGLSLLLVIVIIVLLVRG
jgi:hypothetical protein